MGVVLNDQTNHVPNSWFVVCGPCTHMGGGILNLTRQEEINLFQLGIVPASWLMEYSAG